jgi:aerobactin synthase
MFDPGTDDWRAHADLAGHRRVARALGELCFEDLLRPRRRSDGEYVLDLPEGTSYSFRAAPSLWGGLHVEVGSVTRRVGDGPPAPATSPAQLVLDARLDVPPEALAEFIEELNLSLLAEAGQCARLAGKTAAELAALSGVELEQHLDGHPKLLAHRGRVGWGTADLADFAPEAGARLRLHWLVVAPELARCSGLAGPGDRRLLDESCDPDARARLLDQLHRRAPGLARDGVLVPVHPWQWRRHLAAQYIDPLARGAIVSLGEFGDLYAPRLSIRTLADISRPARADIKLALTILNTSCWRGLPGEHVEHGAGIGAALRRRVEADPLLRDVRVLTDLGGVHVPQPEFEALGAAPYRLRELLGAIWRESAAPRLAPDEREIPAAALQQTDLAGAPLLRAWVDESGATVVDWLTALFRRTAVPLYHLLCRHGIGVIAHGQNLGLVLRGGLPAAIFLRDVHGDVRRLDDPQFDHEPALQRLRALPPEQLVHDLYTGYFVSVLRLVAPLVERGFGLGERDFLRLLAGVLREHLESRPREETARFDLFRREMERICLNRARLRIGHGGGATRPLPALGPPLRNPLVEEVDDER